MSNPQPQQGDRTSAKRTNTRAQAAEKRRQALELRRAGMGYTDIADQVGYRSKGAAHKAVQESLRDIIREPAEDVLAEEIARLDAMLTGLWATARRGNVAAVDRVLKIMDRRARYLGLDRNPPAPELEGQQGQGPTISLAEILGVPAEEEAAAALRVHRALGNGHYGDQQQ